MIEHHAALAFPIVMSSSLVRGIDTSALAFSQTIDALGVMCWLWPHQILQKISAGLDEVSDDKNSLDERQRSEMEATITADAPLIERSECSLIWHAEAAGEIIDWRGDTSPQALLGVRLVTAPRVEASGSTPGYSWDLRR